MPDFAETGADSKNTAVMPPEPRILIGSLRDIGCSFTSAVAGIIDKSISAGATRVAVFAIPDDDFRIGILDDGEGLCDEDPRLAMRLGSSNPPRMPKRNRPWQIRT